MAAEKLREVHEIMLGRETLVGELVQIDGCEHWWFEDRGPQCILLVFVDDATSRLVHLQFVESESTFAYLHAARAYARPHSRFEAIAAPSAMARNFLNEMSGSSLP